MRKRPFIIYIVSAAYLAAAILNALELFQHFELFYPHHYLLLALYPLVGFGVFRVRRWGWYLLIIHLMSILITDIFLFSHFKYPDPRLTGECALLVAFLLFLLRSEVRWERFHRRVDARFTAVIRRDDERAAITNVAGLNLSRGGCSVTLRGAQYLETDERFDLELEFEKHETFHALGRVTRVSSAAEDGSQTAGIDFRRVDKANRRLLREILRALATRSD